MRHLTTERAMQAILFILLFALATRIPVDTDTWWHIRSGEHTLTQGMIYQDPFSHTFAGENWINHSWGSQIILYALWQIGGNVALSLYTALMATLGMVFVYRASAGNTYLRAFVMILAGAAAAVFWSARPQMLSFMLSALVIDLLYRHKRQKKDHLWWIVPLMLVWGNLHAGFSIGFIFIGAMIAGETVNLLLNREGEHNIGWKGIRKLIVVGLLSAAALVVNPYGLNMLLVPFQTVSIGSLRDFIQEWGSPNFQERQTWPFLFMIFALFGAAWAGRRKFDWTDYLLMIGTMFMSFLAGRQIAVFAVAAAPILTFDLAHLLESRGWMLRSAPVARPAQARLNLALIGLVLLGALSYMLATLTPVSVAKAQSEFLPVDAAAYLNEANPPGPMFNSYNWGGYLMFAAPQYPVFVDGRTDLYGEFLRKWLRAALGGSDWREILEEYAIRLVVVEKGSGLEMNLREEPGWRLDYEDDLAVIFVRTEP